MTRYPYDAGLLSACGAAIETEVKQSRKKKHENFVVCGRGMSNPNEGITSWVFRKTAYYSGRCGAFIWRSGGRGWVCDCGGLAEFAGARAADDGCVARKNCGERPVERDLKLFFQRNQFVEVHGVPEEPGEVAVHLKSDDADDRIARAERDEHSLRNVAVGFEALIAFAMRDVACGNFSVSNGHRRNLRSARF